MGGTVAVTARFGDELYKMLRWTNAQPDFVKDARFIQCDRQHFDDWMNAWKVMQADWLANRKTRRFRENMTSAYFPWDKLAPCSYGLIVYDFNQKLLLTMQGYDSFSQIHMPTLADLKRHQNPVVFMIGDAVITQTDPEGDRQRIAQLHSEGRLKFRFRDHANPRNERFEAVPADFDAFIDRASELWRQDMRNDREDETREYVDCVLDLSPWKVERFAETKDGAVLMRQAVLDAGFSLTDKDEREWQRWIKGR